MESFKFDMAVVREDDEFYEDIEAPKFVDLAAPDLAPPNDDPSWFCLRIGCDQNHEQVDPDALYKSFVLRVMAARSPGVRRRKAFNRGDERSIPKCPHSAPAKPPRSRITRLSTATAAAEKTAKPKLKNHPISSLRASPSQTKTTVQASSARKKALTTPRSKNPRPNQEPFLSTKYQKEPVAAARNPAVAKALFMNTPKKACEKNATPLKSQAPVSEICAKMTKLNLASRKREVPSRYLCQLSNPKTLKRGEESRTKCLKKGQESGTNTKKKLLGSLHKCTNPALGEANRNGCNELAREENPGTEAPSAKESTETTKTEIEISNDSRHDLKESRIDADTSQPDNSDNNKENVSSDDKPMDENSRLEINENVPRTVAKMQNKAFHKAFQGNQEQGGKLKRTTNPKPFRLRTDERGILKETNSERKRMLVDQHNGIVVSVHKNGDGAVGSSLTTRQKEKHLEGKGTSKVTSSDKQKKQRIRGATGELVEAKSVANGVPCSKLENTKAKVSEKSQKIPKPASSSRRTIKTASFASRNTMPSSQLGKAKKASVQISGVQATAIVA